MSAVVCTDGNAQATMNINIKPQPGEFPSSEEIDKPMNQQDPGIVRDTTGRLQRVDLLSIKRKKNIQ